MKEQSPQQKRRFPPAAIVGILLAIICGISLYIRIALPYDQVFVGGSIWFRETDAYWYIRNIEVLVRHFPHFNTFDPYILYPGGGGGLSRPFFAWLIAAVSLLVSPGTPSLHTIEVVGAYMPAILGTLTLISVYFIGKELFNRWVGVISAALVAILPGEFLHRSLLGFTDHHVAEVLFSTTCVLFLIMAVKRAREGEISFNRIRTRSWSAITKPLVYTLLAGIFLGFYLLTWQGGLLFIFIIFVYFAIQFIVDHLTGRSTDYLCMIATPVFFIAFLMLVPILGTGGFDSLYWFALPVAILVPIALSFLSRLMAARALRRVYYPLVLLVLLGVGLACLHRINPVLFQAMFEKFSIFKPGGAWLTVMEMQPLTARIAWYNFTTSFFISFVSLGMLVYLVIKERGADKILLLVWSIIMLIAVLGQRRFGYYYALNAGLLTGYLCWKVLDLAGLRKLLARPEGATQAAKAFKKKEKRKHKAKSRTAARPAGAWAGTIVVGIVLFFAVFFPNIPLNRALASAANYVMNEGWYNSTSWLKENTPEPFFGDPDFYYELYETPFQYPESAYGVMSWWDYGYFIMQIGHRIPNANPGQANADKAGMFFTAQGEAAAEQILDRYGLNSKYVMIDYAMATPAKFYAMVEWAGGNVSDYYDVYYQETSSGWQGIYLFYPDFYKSIAVRLYSFDAKAVTPAEVTVVSYEERATTDGQKYKVVTGAQSFSSYEEAQAYVAGQPSGKHKIVGTSPFISIVPLDALTSYELVYQSGDTTNPTTVKIFERLG